MKLIHWYLGTCHEFVPMSDKQAMIDGAFSLAEWYVCDSYKF